MDKKERDRAYYHQHKNEPEYIAKRRAHRRNYYNKNKEKAVASAYEYRNSHKEEFKRYSRKSMRKLYEKRKDMVFELLGSSCSRCGFSDKRALQIDHINGNGKQDKKKYSSNSYYLGHILKVNGQGYQILCANCNWIKRHEQREYSERID